MRRRSLMYGVVSALGAGALLWGLLPATQAVAQTPLGCTTLMAGQHTPAGTVCVTQTSKTTITVTFTTTTPWVMTSVHLAVATTPATIPQANGNPIPGKFPYSYTTTGTFTTHTFTVSGLTAGEQYYVAAHAVVWNQTSEQTVTAVSSTTTQITAATDGGYTIPTGFGLTSGDAVPAAQPTSYPSCTFTTALGARSVWNTGIGSTWSDAFTAAGANWIWNTKGTMIPDGREITGQVVTFTQSLDVPGLPVGPATLSITADNAYRAYLNGTELGQARVGPGFPTTLMEAPTGTPQTGTWGVASQGWQQVGTYHFTPVMGQNTLKVQAANEYMSGGTTYNGTSFKADHYYGWTGSGYNTTVIRDPTPNVTGNYCPNPGGVIFMATASYYAQSETAWGAGTGFPGKNWATYFTFTFTLPSEE